METEEFKNKILNQLIELKSKIIEGKLNKMELETMEGLFDVLLRQNKEEWKYENRSRNKSRNRIL